MKVSTDHNFKTKFNHNKQQQIMPICPILIWYYRNGQNYTNKIKDILRLFIHRKFVQQSGA